MRLIIMKAGILLGLFIFIINANSQTPADAVYNSYYPHSSSITVNNRTGMAVTSVYISPAGLFTWGNNVSTRDIIPNNSSGELAYPIDDYMCLSDIKFYTANGNEYLLQRMNLCNTQNITFLPPKTDVSLSHGG